VDAFSGVALVLIGVRDLETSAALFRTAYNWGAPLLEVRKDPAMRTAFFPGTPVMLATASDERSWVRERIARFGECPLAFLLATPDLGVAKNRYPLGRADAWFGRNLAWFDESQLRGIKLGVIAP
jgi:hypothetical protein